MNNKRFACFCLLIVIIMALTSCSGLTTDPESLIQAPSPTGEYAAISKAFAKVMDDDYNLVFPESGDNTSAYAMHDIDGDGQNEALVFYTLRQENHTLRIHVLKEKKGKWSSAHDYSTSGAGIEKILFADLTGDGALDIVLGISDGTDKSTSLEVLSFSEGYMKCLLKNSYVEFTTNDMDGDGLSELITIIDQYSDNVLLQRFALMCRFNKDGSINKDQASSVRLDKSATSYLSVLSGDIEYTSDKEIYTASALYLDAAKGEGLITEVMYYDKNKRTLVAPLYDSASGSNTSTMRSTDKKSNDVNEDGSIEIPYDIPLPGPDYADTLYLTKWMCLYKDNSLIDILTTYIDKEYKFMLTFPDQWLTSHNITVTQKNNLILFSLWDSELGEKKKDLLEIRLYEDTWVETNTTNMRYIRLGTKYGYVYVARILEEDNKYSITEEQLINGFSFR